jgi:hypothetical protein
MHFSRLQSLRLISPSIRFGSNTGDWRIMRPGEPTPDTVDVNTGDAETFPDGPLSTPILTIGGHDGVHMWCIS